MTRRHHGEWIGEKPLLRPRHPVARIPSPGALGGRAKALRLPAVPVLRPVGFRPPAQRRNNC